MQPSVPRGNRKKVVQPVIVTTENTFKPKLSERTIKKREEAKERKLKGKYASGLDTCGIVCLYVFLVFCVLIGAGGIGVCAYYLNTDSSTVGWKIAGLILSVIVSVIGVILILLTIFKQARNRPWRRKKEEIFKSTDYYGGTDDDSDTNLESLSEEKMDHKSFSHPGSADDRKSVSRSTVIPLATDGKTREIATSPIGDPNTAHLKPKTTTSEMIFCPGCNRTHPSTHQCMYATRIANGFSVQYRPTVSTQQDSIAVQTEEEEPPKRKKRVPHTVIDRSLKYANTTQTQTDVTANPRSNITESIILRRVPIPTSKVVVQQPTTKVMIVKVPNVAGQLVLQQKPGTSTSEQSK